MVEFYLLMYIIDYELIQLLEMGKALMFVHMLHSFPYFFYSIVPICRISAVVVMFPIS